MVYPPYAFRNNEGIAKVSPATTAGNPNGICGRLQCGIRSFKLHPADPLFGFVCGCVLGFFSGIKGSGFGDKFWFGTVLGCVAAAPPVAGSAFGSVFAGGTNSPPKPPIN